MKGKTKFNGQADSEKWKLFNNHAGINGHDKSAALNKAIELYIEYSKKKKG